MFSLTLTPDEANSLGDSAHQKRILATIMVDTKVVKFQMDTGAMCNVMRLSDLPPGKRLEPEDKVLTRYKMKANGKCVLNVRNPKTKQKHRAEFVVVNEAANSILAEQLAQKIGLVEVRYDRIHVIDDLKPLQQEPLMSHEVPSPPWSEVGSDLFEMKDPHYYS